MRREAKKITKYEYEFTASEFEPGAFGENFSTKVNDFLDELNNYYLGRYTVINRKKHKYIDKLMEEKKEVYFRLLKMGQFF